MQQLKHNLAQLFLAFDQLFLNVLPSLIINPFSDQTWADETLSSRCGRLIHRNPYKVYAAIIDALFIWQGPNHCANAFEKEKARYNLPPSMRN